MATKRPSMLLGDILDEELKGEAKHAKSMEQEQDDSVIELRFLCHQVPLRPSMFPTSLQEKFSHCVRQRVLPHV